MDMGSAFGEYAQKIGELGTAYEMMAEELGIDVEDVKALYYARNIVADADNFRTIEPVSSISMVGYFLAGLFSTRGHGAHISHLRYADEDGDAVTDVHDRCAYMLMTPGIPDIRKRSGWRFWEGGRIGAGFLMCADRYGKADDQYVSWYSIGEGEDVGTACDKPFNETCPLTGIGMKIRKLTPEQMARSLHELMESKSELYASHGEEVYKRIKPLVEELNLTAEDLQSRFNQPPENHFVI